MKPATSSEKLITWTTGQVVLATVFVVCVFLIFWLLYRLSFLIFLLFVAIVVGTAIRPMVEWLQRRGISRIAGVIIIYFLLAAFAIGILALVFPLIADQTTQLSQNLPQYYSEIRRALVNSNNRLLQNIASRLPAQLSLFLSANPNAGVDVLNQVTQTVYYANLVVKWILSILAIFLLAYYWTQESSQVVRTLIRLVPLHRRHETQEFIQLAERKIGGYIRGQGILCLVVGFAAFVFYTLIGLPYTLVLAIFAGIMEMIPVFGPALGAIPALLAALSIDPGKAIWVLVATGLIQMMENLFLVPRIMKNSMGVNPIIILLSLVAFGSVFGFAGALLALPLAAMIQLVLDRILIQTDDSSASFSDQVADVPSLIDESKRLMHILDETSNNEDSLVNEIPETDRLEIRDITHELGLVLQELKNQGEMI
ncbi:MAG TPA: AI-2E family transporter [Anaerolineales bacterium]|nr:AI-2E family transporter [Anaerolineales bacterium]